MGELKKSKLLIIDDQEYNVSLLERILRRAGFEHIHSTMQAEDIKHLLFSYQPDIVLLDLHMPVMDGKQVLQYIREQLGEEHYLPVLMLTADITPSVKQEVLEAGANDFLVKPYDRTEVILRINNLLKTRQLHKLLQQNNNKLEERVNKRTEELQYAKFEILELLARAAEYRDDMTGQHTQRVGWLSGKIAEQLGMPEHSIEMIRAAAPLHDIGKIGIPDAVLLKPGRFEPNEFELMKTHTLIGYRILEGTSFSILQLAGVIAMYHHEKWDGSGYPNGLKGDAIPLPARIVALADFYDALTHERPYKRAWTPEETIQEVENQRGKHFDPVVVDAIIRLYKEGKLNTLTLDDVYAG